MKKTKQQLVASILENEVYQPDSDLVERLTRSLLAMSRANLESLELVIGFKAGSKADGTTKPELLRDTNTTAARAAQEPQHG
jgi:hypothetical protein